MRIILAACLAMIGTATGGKCVFAQSGTLAKKLASPCPVEFVDTPLADAAAAVAEKTGVNIALSRRALEGVGVDEESPVTLTLRHADAEGVLDLMLRQLGLTWRVVDEVIVVTTEEDAQSRLSTRVYRVEDLATPNPGGAPDELRDLESLVDLLQTIVAPESWDAGGGAGSIQVIDGALVVAQSGRVLRRLDDLLSALRQAEGNPPASRPDEMKTKVTFKFDRTPLSEFAAALGAMAKVDVIVDKATLEEEGFNTSLKISTQVNKTPLDEALEQSLRPYDLGWIRHRDAALITTKEAADESELTPRVYDVRQIVAPAVDPNHVQMDYGSLVDLLFEVVEPTSWDVAGGPATIVPFDGRLVVAQTRRGHKIISALLEQIRSPVLTAGSPGTTSMEGALATRGDFEFVETPLLDVIEFLRLAREIEVTLDRNSLGEMWPAGDALVTCSLHDVRLDTFLNLALADVGLSWLVEDGVLRITTSDKVKSTLTVKVYPVGDFESEAVQEMADTIPNTISPNSWSLLGGRGAIVPVGRAMAVLNTYPVHREVAELLKKLREVRKGEEVEE